MEIKIEYKGIGLFVDVDYQPFQKGTMEQEHIPSHVEKINSITHNGSCIMELLDNDIDEITEIVTDIIHEDILK